MNICQPVPLALVFEGEFFVVNTHQMQQGCLEVVDVDRVFGNVVAEVVGFSIGNAGFATASGHPDGEAAGRVVAAIVGFGELS